MHTAPSSIDLSINGVALPRFNEQLSAVEVIRTAQETGIRIRKTFLEDEYESPLPTTAINSWEDALGAQTMRNPTSRIRYRTRHHLALDNGFQATPPHGKDSVLLVSGPSGSGKTTIARGIAAKYGLPLVDGDALHTDDAVQTMNHGKCITDAYREREWLPRIEAIVQKLQSETHLPSVLVCSALSDDTRDGLQRVFGDHTNIFCYAPQHVLRRRLANRSHAFIPSDAPAFLEGQITGMLRSQIPLQDNPRGMLLNTHTAYEHTLLEGYQFSRERWTS